MRGVALLVMSLAAGAVASAEEPAAPDIPPDGPHLLFEQGRDLYEHHRYAEAATIFQRLFEINPLPALAFNIGRCFDRLGDAAPAVKWYERYAQEAKPSREVDEVRERIAELRPRIVVETRPAATGNAGDPSNARDAANRRDASRAGRGARIAGVAIGVLGLACLGTGSAFAILGNGAAGDLEALDRDRQPFDPALYHSLATDRALAATFLAVGAAATVIGVVVHLLGRHERARALATPVPSTPLGFVF